MTTAKNKKATPKKKATKKTVKTAKKKFAEGGEVDKEKIRKEMDENEQLQQEIAPQEVEGVPPHQPVAVQEPVVPVSAPTPVVEEKPEPIIEEIKEEVKPVKEKLENIEQEIEKEAGSSKHVFAFFVGAIAGLFLGIKFNK